MKNWKKPKRAEFNRKLEEMAFTDFRTGLPNRRFASDQLTRLWAASSRREASLSCIMVDVDHFKKFNDTMGHKCGDQVLAQVAQVVSSCVRRSDVSARFGGEEFSLEIFSFGPRYSAPFRRTRSSEG